MRSNRRAIPEPVDGKSLAPSHPGLRADEGRQGYLIGGDGRGWINHGPFCWALIMTLPIFSHRIIFSPWIPVQAQRAFASGLFHFPPNFDACLSDQWVYYPMSILTRSIAPDPMTGSAAASGRESLMQPTSIPAKAGSIPRPQARQPGSPSSHGYCTPWSMARATTARKSVCSLTRAGVSRKPAHGPWDGEGLKWVASISSNPTVKHVGAQFGPTIPSPDADSRGAVHRSIGFGGAIGLRDSADATGDRDTFVSLGKIRNTGA